MAEDPGGGRRSALLDPAWHYVEKTALDDFRGDDWACLNRQRAQYLEKDKARQALALLEASRDDASFGYLINNFEHCLQTATCLWRDGFDEETVVCGLFHDIGFIVCPENHGSFAAAMLAPYVSDANRWMLERHAVFQQVHISEYEGVDPDERERWRGHPHFEWTALFVAKYDQNTIDPAFENAPLNDFEPMVHRVFKRPPRQVPLD